jgi:hypothetical protein
MTKDEYKGSGSNTPQHENPFRMLGIAMIVDQKGIGARMVARYPTQPSPVPGNESEDDDQHRDEDESSNDDLFFSLTAFQMAKLFRTKKSLCGQPMTLNVNETVFCCRAMLMDGEEAIDETTTTTTTESKNQLVLFSVIVALSSPVSHTSVPFSWIDGATENQLDLQRYLKEATAASESRSRSSKKATNGSVSSAFLSIRRVHISLARYCRVLEREEKRCQYVSEQAELFFQIRNERQKEWEHQKIASSSVATQQGASNQSSASSSVISGSTAQTGVERRARHFRQKSLEEKLNSKIKSSIKEEQEKEQDILELMLAAFQHKPKESIHGSTKHHGNLVRELVQVFHSLSRNDYEFPPTPAALLCEKDGVVHVNSHIAIPIEATSLRLSQASGDGPLLRPYYTLLFPHASPSELIEAFQSSGSAAPQRLQQLLLTVNPQKPLSEIAVDANLPLYTTMEIASYLVTHGACVATPIVSRNSRLSCLQIKKIPQQALEFSQTFANVSFFRLMGLLTSSQTLGEAMSVLTDVKNDEAAWLRECLAPSEIVQQDLSNGMAYSAEDPSIGPTGQSQQQQQEQRRHRLVEELDESLYAMTIWLLSHRALTQTQEYLVVVDFIPQGAPPVPQKASNDADEILFRELLESDFLKGVVSIMALSWRLGLDEQKVRSWGLRHNRVRVVSRIPAPGDDWEFEFS